ECGGDVEGLIDEVETGPRGQGGVELGLSLADRSAGGDIGQAHDRIDGRLSSDSAATSPSSKHTRVLSCGSSSVVMDSTVNGSAQCLGSLPPSLLRGMELRRVKSVVESPEAPPGFGSPCPDAPPCVESSEGPEPSGAGSSD